MHLLSIDIETTGLDPKQHQIIEFAAVYTDTLDPLRVRAEFRRLVSHPMYIGEAVALAMNADIFREIDAAWKRRTEKWPVDIDKSEVVTLEELLREFCGWVNGFRSGESRITLTGKNVGSFDLAFLRMIEGWDEYKKGMRIGHRCLDVGPLYWSPFDEVMPDLKTCLKRAGLVDMVAHRALNDAHAVLDCIDSYFKLVRNKKSGGSYAIFGSKVVSNANDFSPMVTYINKYRDFFVREYKEFQEKFDWEGK